MSKGGDRYFTIIRHQKYIEGHFPLPGYKLESLTPLPEKDPQHEHNPGGARDLARDGIQFYCAVLNSFAPGYVGFCVTTKCRSSVLPREI